MYLKTAHIFRTYRYMNLTQTTRTRARMCSACSRYASLDPSLRAKKVGQQIYIGDETNISKLGHFAHAQVNVSIASPSAPVISSAVIKPGM